MARPDRDNPDPQVLWVYRSIWIFLGVATLVWTGLFWNELPEMWAAYGLGLALFAWVAWQFRDPASKR